MRSMDISRFTDPRFGPDPYFEKLKDRASCSDMHLKYMFQIVWPLMDTFRKVLVGQRDMTTYLSIGRFAVGDRDFRSDGSVRLGFGHIYFWERPGTGKSLLAKTPSLVLGGTSSRFQGMAGTLPQDYTGNRIIQIDPQTEKKIFELVPGPGFTQMQLLDEFFRSDERTQGAALESLGEGTVTVAGTTYDKHPVTGEPISPFAIITGNPIETKGVYPAIRAFLDRIMFTVRGHEFSAHEFAEILRRTNQFHNVVFTKVCDMETVREVQEFFHREIYVSERIQEDVLGRFAEITNNPYRFGYLKELADEFGGPIVLGGISGRGVCHWEGAAKILAAFRYRNYVTLDDVRKVLLPILRHRLMFAPNVLRLFTDLWKKRDTVETADAIIHKLIKEAW
ncbi:MAG: ATPase [Parcubacteria group bacterium GW2011_GWA2_45_30]|nr:MAG: ATPase [Parcubacteria group bacterium GW2011_GWA2_45_30]